METAIVVGLGIGMLVFWVWFAWNHPILACLLNLLNIFSE